MAALEVAVQEGDILTMEAILAMKPLVRWNHEAGAITGVDCDGSPVKIAAAWLGGSVRTESVTASE